MRGCGREPFAERVEGCHGLADLLRVREHSALKQHGSALQLNKLVEVARAELDRRGVLVATSVRCGVALCCVSPSLHPKLVGG